MCLWDISQSFLLHSLGYGVLLGISIQSHFPDCYRYDMKKALPYIVLPFNRLSIIFLLAFGYHPRKST